MASVATSLLAPRAQFHYGIMSLVSGRKLYEPRGGRLTGAINQAALSQSEAWRHFPMPFRSHLSLFSVLLRRKLIESFIGEQRDMQNIAMPPRLHRDG